MSNRWPALLVALACQSAFAQSSALLESVRVRRPGVREQAAIELQQCLDLKPQCAEADRLSLLNGFLALAESDGLAAVRQLKSRAPPKGLESYFGWYLGESYAWSGQSAEAIKTFKGIRKNAPAWLQKKIDTRTGELLLFSQQAKLALPLLDAATEADPTPELLYQRGLARQLTGDRIRAATDFKTLLVKFAAHPHAELAMQRLTAQGKPPAFAFDERLARVNQFLASGNSARALEEIELTVPPTGRAANTGKARLAVTRAVVLFARGDEAGAQAQLDLASQGPPSVAADVIMIRARRAMRSGDNKGGQELLRTLDQKYPAEAGADDAAYLAAWLSLQAGQFAEAATAFENFEAHHPGSKKRDEARWFKAYSLYRAGQFQSSRDGLLTLQIDFPKSQLVPQAKYWAARGGQQLGSVDGGTPPQQVTDDYRAVMATAPGTFYALLASERLRELGQTVAPVFTETPRAMAVEMPKQLLLAQLLARTGLFRDAADESQRALSSVGNADTALRFGHALQQVGEFGAAHTLAARWLWGAAYGAKTPEALALMYPLAFRESVEKACAERGLDPYLAWAIMRRESAFRPDVSSAADARGLMQIIPPTARAIAKELKIEAPSADDLYSPEENISLGTWYLTQLLDRFNHPSLMAAAYNAGPTPVARWAIKNGELPIDQWVEEIPYKETRAYVKQVTADVFIYRSLYGHSTEGLPMKVPTPRDGGVSF